MTLTASLRLNISLPDVLSAYRQQLLTLPHMPWHEAYDCLMQPSAGVAQQHLVDVPQAASRKPVTSPGKQALAAVSKAKQAAIKIKPIQARSYFKPQVNQMPIWWSASLIAGRLNLTPLNGV
jgi:hypothetical protein